MKNLKRSAITLGTGALICGVFVSCGTYIHNQYNAWQASNALLATRVADLEATQKEDRVEMQVIARQTTGELRDIKAILQQDRKKVKYSVREIQCLANNIYHEAGVESDKGKLAVGQVTLNRLATKRWGDTICDVVYAKAQFSWTLDAHKLHEKPEGELWEDSKKAAARLVKGERLKRLTTSLYYHTDYIATPKWADPKAKLTKIDQHIFYQTAKLILTKKCPINKAIKCAHEHLKNA